MTVYRLLDLFSGAGGCAEGYARAGFDVIGVDVAPQPRYPYEFHQADALDVLARLVRGERWEGYALADFAVVHLSPPCQRWTIAQARWGREDEHPDLITPTRELLAGVRKPYVIENVPAAPLRSPVTLCGSSFRLRVRRHRSFESNLRLRGRPCDHGWQDRTPIYPAQWSRSKRSGRTGVITVYGNGGGGPGKAPPHVRREAMGIPWMTEQELSEAIPPAFTEYLGRQLRRHLDAMAAR